MSSRKTGIEFKNILKETEAFHVLKYGYFYNGGGVAIGDLNNDGLPDIYFTGNLVASRLYLNQGNLQFAIKSLPKEAQVAPVFAIEPLDVNADGKLDLLLGGNVYGTRIQLGIMDANHGVVLLGDGKGSFAPLSPQQSGLWISGEVRGIKAVISQPEQTQLLMVKSNGPLEIFTLE